MSWAPDKVKNRSIVQLDFVNVRRCFQAKSGIKRDVKKPEQLIEF